jgi:hypothetical protein
MKREEMRRKIDEELKLIPRSFRGSEQNLLRFYYNVTRMTDLARNPLTPAKETLSKAVEAMKRGKNI